MKLVFATHNKNKFREVQLLLPKYIELLSLTDIGCDEDIPETAGTIEGNAALKANFVKMRYGHDCFADDTGLEVNALDGEPGIYSARYAGPEKDSKANTKKLLKKLKGVVNREARFKTAIALTMREAQTMFLGICDGKITEAPRGTDGFGYDPVFQPKDHSATFAEMTLSEKNKIGHRGKAMRQLIEYLSE